MGRGRSPEPNPIIPKARGDRPDLERQDRNRNTCFFGFKNGGAWHLYFFLFVCQMQCSVIAQITRKGLPTARHSD